jgi:hypothetical protein
MCSSEVWEHPRENAQVWEPPLQQKALLNPRALAFYPNSLGYEKMDPAQKILGN